MKAFYVRDPYAPVAEEGGSAEASRSGGVWVKGQLHAHTSRSFDGRMSPQEVMAAYRALGFGFVCITDHDRLWDTYLRDQGLLVVPGEESTLFRPLPPLGRHLLRLFVAEPVPALAPASAKMDATVRAGGILAVAHPAWNGNFGTGRWRLEALCDPRLSLIEIVNHHAPTRENVALWDAALAARGPASPLWATAVDDSHRAEQVGRAWVWVRMQRPLDAFASPQEATRHVRDALARGTFYPSTGARARFRVIRDGSEVVIAAEVERPGHASSGQLIGSPRSPEAHDGRGPQGPTVIRFVAGGGRPLAEVKAPEGHYTVQGDEGYVRVEVELADGAAAWSQPFWIVQTQERVE